MFLTLGLEMKSRQTCYTDDVLTKLSFPWEGSLCFWQLQFTCLSSFQMLNYGTLYWELWQLMLCDRLRAHTASRLQHLVKSPGSNAAKPGKTDSTPDFSRCEEMIYDCLGALSHFINSKLIIIILVVVLNTNRKKLALLCRFSVLDKKSKLSSKGKVVRKWWGQLSCTLCFPAQNCPILKFKKKIKMQKFFSIKYILLLKV